MYHSAAELLILFH